MDFRFSEEEERFRRDVKEFLARELPPGWVGFRGLGERVETPEEIAFFKEMAKRLGRKGWLSLAWPREFGGAGASHMIQLIFEEEMQYHRAPGKDIFGTGMLAPSLPQLRMIHQAKKLGGRVVGNEQDKDTPSQNRGEA